MRTPLTSSKRYLCSCLSVHDLDMEGPCEICGDVGCKEALVTCSKCSAREHVYCMRVLSMDFLRSWTCEDCLPIQGNKSVGSREVAHSPSTVSTDLQEGPSHQKKLKRFQTGKVKFLPVDEAIRLSSGTKGIEFHERYNSSSASPRKKVIPKSYIPRMSEISRVKIPVTQLRPSSGSLRKEYHEYKNFRTAKPLESVISKLPSPKLVGNTCFKHPSHDGVQIMQNNNHPIADTSEKSRGDACFPYADVHGSSEVKTSEPWMKEVETSEPRMNEVETSEPRMNEVETSEPTMKEVIKNKAVYAGDATSDQPSKQLCPISIGKSIHAVAGNDSSFKEQGLLLNGQPKFELYCQHLPAKRATWNGNFLFPETVTLEEKFSGFLFQAHPACKVHPKAFEVSQNLPYGLKVNLLQRYPLWKDLFGDETPDFDDIALYFFPADNSERSKRNYFYLIKFLESENSMLRSYVDAVELLIFTSKELQLDSQKILARLRTPYFLWGVFRRVKPDHNLHPDGQDIPWNFAGGPANSDGDDQAIDMEIDMEGGMSVGRHDVVISRGFSNKPSGCPCKTSASSKENIANAMTELLPPPGFEGVAFYSRVSGLASLETATPSNLVESRNIGQGTISDARRHNPGTVCAEDGKMGSNDQRKKQELKIKVEY